MNPKIKGNMKDSSSETLILESSTSYCDLVRRELQNKFPLLWIYVYSKNTKISFITVSNSLGGKLEKNLTLDITSYAKQYLEKLKSKKPLLLSEKSI